MDRPAIKGFAISRAELRHMTTQFVERMRIKLHNTGDERGLK